VLLYSPSLNSHRRENTDLAEELASHGFVVIGLDHRETFKSVFPDGRVVLGQLLSVSDWNSLVVRLPERTQDARFVLDELARLQALGDQIASHLNLDSVGAFGFSFGGSTAAQLCISDSRVKCGINMDGAFTVTNVVATGIGKPFLILRSDSPDPIPEDPVHDDRRRVFDVLTNAAYWVKVSGTEHYSFHEFALIYDPATFRATYGGAAEPTARRVHQMVATYTLAFFNKHLLGRDEPLLDGPPLPEVKEFLRK
jgi:predicted dienelactone hydrolase